MIIYRYTVSDSSEALDSMRIITDGGTTFTVKDDVVTITRSDQPECTIPLADLKEFADLLEDDDEGDDLE